MGRWRPPQPKKSKYITAEGYKRLNDELKYLWKSETSGDHPIGERGGRPG